MSILCRLRGCKFVQTIREIPEYSGRGPRPIITHLLIKFKCSRCGEILDNSWKLEPEVTPEAYKKALEYNKSIGYE